MSETTSGTNAPAAAAPAPKPTPFRTFLELSPPDADILVSGRSVTVEARGYNSEPSYKMTTPPLELHCEICDGKRTFDSSNQHTAYLDSGENYEYLFYKCRNCKKFTKAYSLLVFETASIGTIRKLGENPIFGPLTPRALFKFIGEGQKEMFLQGRRAEISGLGIGANTYYRRIVEAKKDEIIDKLKQVAAKHKIGPDLLAKFDEAKKERQFSTAIEIIKDAIPASLLIGDHNPLTILHDALSDGVHSMTDEECLEQAQNIRILLTELAERVAEIVKDESVVTKALGALMNRHAKKQQETKKELEDRDTQSRNVRIDSAKEL